MYKICPDLICLHLPTDLELEGIPHAIFVFLIFSMSLGCLITASIILTMSDNSASRVHFAEYLSAT